MLSRCLGMQVCRSRTGSSSVNTQVTTVLLQPGHLSLTLRAVGCWRQWLQTGAAQSEPQARESPQSTLLLVQLLQFKINLRLIQNNSVLLRGLGTLMGRLWGQGSAHALKGSSTHGHTAY